MRRMWWVPVLAGIVLAGGVARAWRLPSLELQHWDEGPYALGGQWLVTEGRDGEPMVPFYAPPLFPVVVAAVFDVAGISAPAAIAVSVVLGTATILALFALLRHAWGTGPALAGSWLLATCDYHLIYSRVALTDATFVLLVVLALAACARALRGERLSAYALAGALTGLCQNTKYHGIAVLLMAALYVGADAVAGAVRRRPWRRGLRLRGAGLLLALGITLAMYTPWALLVHTTVGYGTLLAHTRSYAALWATPPRYLLDCATSFMSPAVLVLAAVGTVVSLAGRRPQGRLAVLAFGAFAVMATLYHPYPRLLVPAAVLACGLGGVGLTWLFGLMGTAPAGGRLVLARGAAGILLGACVGADALHRGWGTLSAPPAGYARAAAELADCLAGESLSLPGSGGPASGSRSQQRRPWPGFGPAGADLDGSGAQVWTDVQYCFRFYLSREMRERVRRVDTAEDAIAFVAPQPVVRYLVVDLRVLRHRSSAGVYLAYLERLDGEGLAVRRLANPLYDVTLLNTLTFQELSRVRGESDPALGRRALEIAIYRIPAGWPAQPLPQMGR